MGGGGSKGKKGEEDDQTLGRFAVATDTGGVNSVSRSVCRSDEKKALKYAQRASAAKGARTVTILHIADTAHLINTRGKFSASSVQGPGSPFYLAPRLGTTLVSLAGKAGTAPAKKTSGKGEKKADDARVALAPSGGKGRRGGGKVHAAERYAAPQPESKPQKRKGDRPGRNGGVDPPPSTELPGIPPSCVVTSGGDAFSPGVVGAVHRGALGADLTRSLGVSVAVAGNRDVDAGVEGYAECVERAGYTVLLANAAQEDFLVPNALTMSREAWVWTAPCRVSDGAGGVFEGDPEDPSHRARVLFIGVCDPPHAFSEHGHTDDHTSKAPQRPWADSVETMCALAEAAHASERYDAIVAITHQRITEDNQVCDRCPFLACVLGAHETETGSVSVRNGVPIVKPRRGFGGVGVVTINLPPVPKSSSKSGGAKARAHPTILNSVRAEVVRVSPSTPPHPAVAAIADRCRNAAAAALDVFAGRLPRDVRVDSGGVPLAEGGTLPPGAEAAAAAAAVAEAGAGASGMSGFAGQVAVTDVDGGDGGGGDGRERSAAARSRRVSSNSSAGSPVVPATMGVGERATRSRGGSFSVNPRRMQQYDGGKIRMGTGLALDAILGLGNAETAIGNLSADTAREYLRVDCVLIDAGSLGGYIGMGHGTPVAPGATAAYVPNAHARSHTYPVTLGQLLRAVRPDTGMTVMAVHGRDIVRALELSVSKYPTPNEAFLQVSGIEFAFVPSGSDVSKKVAQVTTPFNTVVEARRGRAWVHDEVHIGKGRAKAAPLVSKVVRSSVRIHGAYVEDAKEYTVAVTRRIAEGKGPFAQMLTGARILRDDDDSPALFALVRNRLRAQAAIDAFQGITAGSMRSELVEVTEVGDLPRSVIDRLREKIRARKAVRQRSGVTDGTILYTSNSVMETRPSGNNSNNNNDGRAGSAGSTGSANNNSARGRQPMVDLSLPSPRAESGNGDESSPGSEVVPGLPKGPHVVGRRIRCIADTSSEASIMSKVQRAQSTRAAAARARGGKGPNEGQQQPPAERISVIALGAMPAGDLDTVRRGVENAAKAIHIWAKRGGTGSLSSTASAKGGREQARPVGDLGATSMSDSLLPKASMGAGIKPLVVFPGGALTASTTTSVLRGIGLSRLLRRSLGVHVGLLTPSETSAGHTAVSQLLSGTDVVWLCSGTRGGVSKAKAPRPPVSPVPAKARVHRSREGKRPPRTRVSDTIVEESESAESDAGGETEPARSASTTKASATKASAPKPAKPQKSETKPAKAAARGKTRSEEEVITVEHGFIAGRAQRPGTKRYAVVRHAGRLVGIVGSSPPHAKGAFDAADTDEVADVAAVCKYLRSGRSSSSSSAATSTSAVNAHGVNGGGSKGGYGGYEDDAAELLAMQQADAVDVIRGGGGLTARDNGTGNRVLETDPEGPVDLVVVLCAWPRLTADAIERSGCADAVLRFPGIRDGLGDSIGTAASKVDVQFRDAAGSRPRQVRATAMATEPLPASVESAPVPARTASALQSWLSLAETDLENVVAHVPRALPWTPQLVTARPSALGALAARCAMLSTGADLALVPAACFLAQGDNARPLKGSAASMRMYGDVPRGGVLPVGRLRLKQLVGIVHPAATVRVVSVPFVAESPLEGSMLYKCIERAMGAVGTTGFCQMAGVNLKSSRGGVIRGEVKVGDTVIQGPTAVSRSSSTTNSQLVSKSGVVLSGISTSSGPHAGGSKDTNGTLNDIRDVVGSGFDRTSTNKSPTTNLGDLDTDTDTDTNGNGNGSGKQRVKRKKRKKAGPDSMTSSSDGAGVFAEHKCLRVAIVIPPRPYGDPSRVAIDLLFDDESAGKRPLDLGPLLPGPPLAIALRRDLAVRSVVTAAVGGATGVQAAARIARRWRGMGHVSQLPMLDADDNDSVAMDDM